MFPVVRLAVVDVEMNGGSADKNETKSTLCCSERQMDAQHAQDTATLTTAVDNDQEDSIFYNEVCLSVCWFIYINNAHHDKLAPHVVNFLGKFPFTQMFIDDSSGADFTARCTELNLPLRNSHGVNLMYCGR